MPVSKKALCVGVNYAGTDAALRGAANDALTLSELLVRQCGFGRRNVVVLIDEYPSGEAVEDDDERYSRPTKENLLEALEWLCEDVSPGDVLVFAFSGHGAVVSDSAAPGAERLEEALCPVDWDGFEWGAPQRLLTEQELHAGFCRLPAGASLTLLLDASLMGSLARCPLLIDFEQPDRELDVSATDGAWTQAEYRASRPGARPWLCDLQALPRRLPREPQAPLWRRFGRLFVRDASPPLEEGLAVFCFSACGGRQTAVECCLEGRPQGVLTYALQQGLGELGRCSYLELCEAMDRVAQRLTELLPLDQRFRLGFQSSARPADCGFLDSASGRLAQERARRRRGQRSRPRLA